MRLLCNLLKEFSKKSKSSITPHVFRKDYNKPQCTAAKTYPELPDSLHNRHLYRPPSQPTIISPTAHLLLKPIDCPTRTVEQLKRQIQSQELMKLNHSRYLNALTSYNQKGQKEGEVELMRQRLPLFLKRYGFKLDFSQFCQLSVLLQKYQIPLEQSFILHIYRHIQKATYLNIELESAKLWQAIQTGFKQIKALDLEDQALKQRVVEWSEHQFAERVVNSLPTLLNKMYKGKIPFPVEELGPGKELFLGETR